MAFLSDREVNALLKGTSEDDDGPEEDDWGAAIAEYAKAEAEAAAAARLHQAAINGSIFPSAESLGQLNAQLENNYNSAVKMVVTHLLDCSPLSGQRFVRIVVHNEIAVSTNTSLDGNSIMVRLPQSIFDIFTGELESELRAKEAQYWKSQKPMQCWWNWISSKQPKVIFAYSVFQVGGETVISVSSRVFAA